MSKPPRRSLYEEDLAYVHHVGFGAFARHSAPGLLGILRRAGITKGTLVDLGCGSGIWAEAAQRTGFNVLGVDQSAAMVRLARKVAPNAEFRCASLADFAVPHCQAITALGEAFNYLPASGGPGPRLVRLFRRFAASLQPGGLLLFDALMAGNESLDRRNWQVGDDWAVLYVASEDRARRRLSRKNICFRRRGQVYRRSEETHHLRVFEFSEVADALKSAGFSFRGSACWGKHRLSTRRMAFVARKKRK